VLPTLLSGKVSIAKLKYLLYTAKSISATEAERIGLITEVVEDGDLDKRVHEICSEIRQTSPIARALYKEYVGRLIPTPANSDLYRAMASPECREGLKAFAEKRKAKYGSL
jgi:enoyl-CoA hydratase/carnithine racemase